MVTRIIEVVLPTFLVVIVPIFLVAMVASYATSVMCRLALLRHRHFNWRSGIVGAGAAGVCSIAFMSLGLSLQPGNLPYLDSFLKWILLVSLGGSLFGLLPAETLVWYYHQRFRNHDRRP